MAVLDLQIVLLCAIVAILIAIALSLKALFAIERRLFRMDENIIRLTGKILREEDEIESLLTRAIPRIEQKKSAPARVKRASTKKPASRRAPPRKKK